MKLFDYLYYRLASWFYKTDGEHGLRAAIFISIAYFAIAISFSYNVYLSLLNGSDYWLEKNQKYALLYVSIIWCFVSILTYKKYLGRFSLLKERWGTDNMKSTPVKTFASLLFYFTIIIISWITVF